VNDVVPAFESDDPSAAMVRHQNPINRLGGIEPYNRHFSTHASRAASGQGEDLPKSCHRLQ
jgi:hypothetical protein